MLGAGIPGVSLEASAQAAPDSVVAPASAPVPFTCEAKLYQSAEPGPRLYVYDPVTNTYSTVGSDIATGDPNGMGYNTADDFIYANYLGDLIRVDATGTYTTVGQLRQNGVSLATRNAGDFWGPNRLLLGNSGSNDWKRVDVSDPTNPIVYDFSLSGETFRSGAADFTVVGHTAFGLSPTGSTTPMKLSVVNLSTQVVQIKDTTGAKAAGTAGAAYADALGNVYFHVNQGSVYRILAEDLDDTNPLVTSMGPAPTAGGGVLDVPNDGASCPDAGSAFSATITNETTSAVTASAAALSADVNPNGMSTTVRMCVGTSSATSGGALQGCTLTSQPTNADDTTRLTGTSSVTLTPVSITGLSPRTTYYWQAIATSSATTTYGSVVSFTTTGPPVVTTQPASSVAVSSATVNGLVNPGGLSTSASFCFGTAADLNGCSSTSAQTLAAGSSDQPVSASLTGLVPGTRYYYRVDAANTDGSVAGAIRSFTTSAVPTVVIGTTTDITPTDALLNATVNPEGLATTVTFCFGTAANLSNCTQVPASQSPLVGVESDLPVTADLTGLTPATTYYARVTAVNANGSAVSTDTSFTTAPAPLQLTTLTGALPTGVVGVPYSKTLSAAGGTAPYTWSVIGGLLPGGLTLNGSTGTVSGVPTTAGNSSFTVRVTDANNQDDSKVFTMSVVRPPVATVSPATSVGPTSAALSGSVDPGNLVSTAEFCIGTNPDMSGCAVIAADQSPLAVATTAQPVSVSAAGLSPGTTYFVRVQAANSAGSGSSPITSFTTSTAPTAVTGAATFREKDGDAILNATVKANGADATVSFCWGSTRTLVGCTSGPATPTPVTDDSGTVKVSRTVTGLTLGATYYFAVTATNSVGTSVGATVEFTMPTANAPSPTITAVAPPTGDAAGGESIVITGTNFSTAGIGVSVEIGGNPATVTSLTSTSITVTTPPGVVGPADIVVSNNDGQAVRATGLFAYTSPSYSVTYAGNGSTGGSVPVDATTYTYGSYATVDGPGTLVRSGYEFLGWNTSASGSGTNVLVGSRLLITGAVTLFAQWQAMVIIDPSTVSFGAWPIDGGPSAPQTVTVTNASAGNVSVTAGGIAIAGAGAGDFAVSGGTCSNSGVLAGGTSCTVEVVFDPAAEGPRSATISVVTTAGTVSATLTGVGTVPNPQPGPPGPFVAPGPPRQVTAVPGDGSAQVAWLPPASAGSFPITSYRVTSQQDGRSCVVSAPTLTCTIEGLANGTNYTFVVEAFNAAGWGPEGGPSAPVRPRPTSVPLPVPVPPLVPGETDLEIDLQPEPVEVEPNDEGNGLDITADGWTMTLNGVGPDGEPLDLGPDGVLVIDAERDIRTTGTAFAAGSLVTLYLNPPTRTSPDVDPVNPDDDRPTVLLGTVLVRSDGTFDGSTILPEDIEPGDHVVQAVGFGPGGDERALSIGIVVRPWIELDRGTRAPAGLHDRIRATGDTGGIDEGELLVPWIKYNGQGSFKTGVASIVVQADGTFRWTRLVRKTKGLAAYVSWREIQSNEVFWRKVR